MVKNSGALKVLFSGSGFSLHGPAAGGNTFYTAAEPYTWMGNYYNMYIILHKPYIIIIIHNTINPNHGY